MKSYAENSYIPKRPLPALDDQMGRYRDVERARIQDECRRNLRDWLRSLPAPWKHANLSEIKAPAAKKADSIVKNEGCSSFFIEGPEGAGKTYLSYAILRRYIGKGWVAPSQIKFITEHELLSMASTGYLGKTEFNQFLKSGFSVFVIDNVGTKTSYAADKDLLFWERFIEHVYTHHCTVILTSPFKLDHFLKLLSPSGEAKVRDMVEGHVLRMPQISLQDVRSDETDVGDGDNLDTILKTGIFK